MLWSIQKLSFEYNPEIEFYQQYVPTNETTKVEYLLNILSKGGHNIYIKGPTVGKTTMINHYLNDVLNNHENLNLFQETEDDTNSDNNGEHEEEYSKLRYCFSSKSKPLILQKVSYF